MAKYTEVELNELSSLIRDYWNTLRKSEQVAAGLTIKHPIFRGRSVDIPMSPKDTKGLTDALDAAETALQDKFQQLANV